MKKCFLIFFIIYVLYVWLPPFITVLFPVSNEKIIGNYILSTCTAKDCAFYNIHFKKNNEVVTHCVDNNGSIKKQSINRWYIKNGHTIVLENNFNDFMFPRFGDIHRNMFFPWEIKIETQINGQCQFDEWNFAEKIGE